MAGNNDHSSQRSGSSKKAKHIPGQVLETIRRAFVEFLTIPTVVIVGFLALAVIMFVLDEARIVREGQASNAMWGGLFSDPQATRDFLGVIAASIITVTSITLSLLLIAVQQGAASLTSLVFDQFLRRRTNQLYFGFFHRSGALFVDRADEHHAVPPAGIRRGDGRRNDHRRALHADHPDLHDYRPDAARRHHPVDPRSHATCA